MAEATTATQATTSAAAATTATASATTEAAATTTTAKEQATATKEQSTSVLASKTSNAPAEYKLSLPENTRLTKADLDRISTLSREKGLSQEAAAERVATEHDVLSRDDAARSEGWKTLTGGWLKECESHPEFGGEKFKESVAQASRFLDKVDPKREFRDELQRLGFDNHPRLFEVFARAGRLIADDKAVTGGQPRQSNNDAVDAKLRKMFPSSYANEQKK